MKSFWSLFHLGVNVPPTSSLSSSQNDGSVLDSSLAESSPWSDPTPHLGRPMGRTSSGSLIAGDASNTSGQSNPGSRDSSRRPSMASSDFAGGDQTEWLAMQEREWLIVGHIGTLQDQLESGAGLYVPSSGNMTPRGERFSGFSGANPNANKSPQRLHDRGQPEPLPAEVFTLHRYSVVLFIYNLRIMSSLYLSNYRLCLRVHDARLSKCNVEIPLSTIRKLEGNLFIDGLPAFKVLGKDGQRWAVGFVSDQPQRERDKIVSVLESWCFPSTRHSNPFGTLFCFKNREEFVVDGVLFRPGVLFDMECELNRIGVPCERWRITHVNVNFEMCPSYPRILATPAKITDQDLKNASEYRTSGRVPVLCWMHPTNKAVLCRSSQPKTGIMGRHSAADIQLVSDIFSDGNEFYIFDARPFKNAVGNALKGAGYENPVIYSNPTVEHRRDVQLDFMNIENIHVIRKSFNYMCHILEGDMNKPTFLTDLETAGWLNHLSYILSGTCKIVKMIAGRSTSTLVHCSDGWDRTSQLVSLAELLLDPYFRTIRGFICLIEKEWLSFGHKFAARSGQNQSSNIESKEFSPIFVQWLDCVYQIIRQYPCSFQFNDRLLLTLCEHVYSCRFGTFLFDCERERHVFLTSSRTPSLWGYILSHERDFTNVLFDEEKSHHNRVLLPRANVRDLRVWRKLFKGRSPIIDNIQQLLVEQSIKADQYTRLVEQIQQQQQLQEQAKVQHMEEQAKAQQMHVQAFEESQTQTHNTSPTPDAEEPHVNEQQQISTEYEPQGDEADEVGPGEIEPEQPTAGGEDDITQGLLQSAVQIVYDFDE